MSAFCARFSTEPSGGEDSGKLRSLNYFWGMSSGVVEMIYLEHSPESEGIWERYCVI